MRAVPCVTRRSRNMQNKNRSFVMQAADFLTKSSGNRSENQFQKTNFNRQINVD